MEIVHFGFTGAIVCIYMLLIGLAVFAFIKKKVAAGIAIIVISTLVMIAIAALWIISPM